MEFLPRTFQLTQGVGPWREKDLWARDLSRWEDFERAAAAGVVMSARHDRDLLVAIDAARRALAARDLPALATLVPAREHWRLFGHFPDSAAFFDIEADGDDVPTVVGVMDAEGVATFRRGTTLDEVPARLARAPLWVTFNGGAYDVPALRRYFGPGFPTPRVHVDLRFLVRRGRLSGGLKAIERVLGLGRPPHLEGVRGLDAIRLWREWEATGDPAALRILVEYNLYDAINLRAVLEQCAWRIAEGYAWDVDRQPTFERGDVLYDVSRLVLAQPGES
jgi:uncharacterized protein YprB with RNaseH-like and TPR domain